MCYKTPSVLVQNGRITLRMQTRLHVFVRCWLGACLAIVLLLLSGTGKAARPYRVSLKAMGAYAGTSKGKRMSQASNPGPNTMYSPVDKRYFAVFFLPRSVTIKGQSILITIGDRTGATGPAYNRGNLKYNKDSKTWYVSNSGAYMRVHYNKHDYKYCKKGLNPLTYAGKGPEEITCKCDADLDLITGLSKTYSPGAHGRMVPVDPSLYRIEGSNIVIMVDGDPPDAGADAGKDAASPDAAKDAAKDTAPSDVAKDTSPSDAAAPRLDGAPQGDGSTGTDASAGSDAGADTGADGDADAGAVLADAEKRGDGRDLSADDDTSPGVSCAVAGSPAGSSVTRAGGMRQIGGIWGVVFAGLFVVGCLRRGESKRGGYLV